MVYADGLDLASRDAVVPVGPSCRLCERMDCEQRAYPPLHSPFTVDENRRGVSFYAAPPPVKAVFP
jgi:predicted transcriptional regulator